MPPQGSGDARPDDQKGASATPDAFTPDTGKPRSSTSKSPFSGVPYYVASSQNGLRDKLPRTNVPPNFMEMVGRAIASDKVPQWNSNDSVIRFMLMVGVKEVEKILDDPAIGKIVNQFSSLAWLETVEASTKTSREVMARAEQILYDTRSTPAERVAARQAVTDAMNATDDPAYQRKFRQLLNETQNHG